MAELHVETKKHSAGSASWLWILLALIVIAVVVYFFINCNSKAATDNTPAAPASPVSQLLPANAVFYS